MRFSCAKKNRLGQIRYDFLPAVIITGLHASKNRTKHTSLNEIVSTARLQVLKLQRAAPHHTSATAALKKGLCSDIPTLSLAGGRFAGSWRLYPFTDGP